MKRKRTNSNAMVIVKANRPIDKNIVMVIQTITNTQTSTTLTTAAFPCTITGLRWDLIGIPTTAGACNIQWAIVRVRQGQTAATLVATDGASIYGPEQDIMAFGHFYLPDSDVLSYPLTNRGKTKTMRKLMVGDTLKFIALGSVVTTGQLRAEVQFFSKS